MPALARYCDERGLLLHTETVHNVVRTTYQTENVELAHQGLDKVSAYLIELRAEFRSEIGDVRTELRAETAAIRREILGVEMRQATRTTALNPSTRTLVDMLDNNYKLRDRVAECEREIVDIKQRLES